MLEPLLPLERSSQSRFSFEPEVQIPLPSTYITERMMKEMNQSIIITPQDPIYYSNIPGESELASTNMGKSITASRKRMMKSKTQRKPDKKKGLFMHNQVGIFEHKPHLFNGKTFLSLNDLPKSSVSSTLEVEMPSTDDYYPPEPMLFDTKHVHLMGVCVVIMIIVLGVVLGPFVFLFWSGVTLVEIVTGEPWKKLKVKREKYFYVLVGVGALMSPMIMGMFLILKIMRLLTRPFSRLEGLNGKLNYIYKYFYSQSCFPGDD